MAWTTKKDTRKLDSIIRQMAPEAERVLTKVAFDIQDIAQNLAPVDTGALQNSIRVLPPKKLERIVADGVEYGVNVEIGTSRQSAQPFMRPAFEANRKPFGQALKALLR